MLPNTLDIWHMAKGITKKMKIAVVQRKRNTKATTMVVLAFQGLLYSPEKIVGEKETRPEEDTLPG